MAFGQNVHFGDFLGGNFNPPGQISVFARRRIKQPAKSRRQFFILKFGNLIHNVLLIFFVGKIIFCRHPALKEQTFVKFFHLDKNFKK